MLFDKNLSGLKFKPFNPLIAPGNVAIYDGDVNCSSANWKDNAGGNQITFFNAPTYNATGLNGHGTILFNGTTQYGNSTTPSNIQPYTIYIVFRKINESPSAVILNDGSNFNRKDLNMDIGDNIKLRTGGAGTLDSNPDIGINTWSIFTIVANSPNCILRTNLNSAIIGNTGNANGSGINLAASLSPSDYGYVEVAFIIMRNVADPTWLQNNFINWLKNHFAI